MKIKELTKNKIGLLLMLLSLIIFSINILDFSWYPDFGVEAYIGQELARGYPVFSTAVFAKPPMGYFVDALWIKLFFFLPNYLAIRLGGMLLGSITVLLFYKVLTKCIKNSLIPIVSSLILLCFTYFIRNSLHCGFKPIMMFFTFSMFLFLFKKRYLFSGFLASLCFMTWQPGGVFLFGPISYYFLNKKKKKNYVKFFVGFAIPLILIILYFHFNGLLEKFINYVFIYMLGSKKEIRYLQFEMIQIRNTLGFWNTELLFILFSLITTCLFLFRLIRKIKNKGVPKHIKNKKLFSFLFPHFLLFLYLAMDYQGGSDLIPLLPIISLFSAIFIKKINLIFAKFIAKLDISLETAKKISLVIILALVCTYGFLPMFQPVYPENPLITEGKGVKSVQEMFGVATSNRTLSEVIYLLFFRRRGREMTLEDQLKIADYVKDGKIFSFGAPEILVLSEKRNINDRIFLTSVFLRYYAERDGIVEELGVNVTKEAPEFIVSWKTANNKAVIDLLDIEEFLENNYKKVDLHPKYIIWRRLG